MINDWTPGTRQWKAAEYLRANGDKKLSELRRDAADLLRDDGWCEQAEFVQAMEALMEHKMGIIKNG